MVGGYNPKWTDHELALLAEYYPIHGAKWDGWKELLPDRSTRAIEAMASSENLIRDSKTEVEEVEELFWTKSQDRQLLSAVHQIAELTDHSALAVARRLSKLIRTTHGKMRIDS